MSRCIAGDDAGPRLRQRHRGRLRALSWRLVLIHATACSSSVAHTETAQRPPQQPVTTPAPAQPPARAASHAAAAQAQEQAAAGTGAGAAVLEGAPLPERIDAGEIPRATLLAVLSAGVGRFLQKVRAEPHLVDGRFVGWRLLSLFDGEPALQAGVLQPGDTVMRVNGQSIERPEQFKNVWDSMATESDLVLQVQRAGKQSRVHYRIVDAR